MQHPSASAAGPRRVEYVDVFTQVPCLGNPVAVVLGADGMTSVQMQQFAAWTNLSETTFVTSPASFGVGGSGAVVDESMAAGGAAAAVPTAYTLRIFTPRSELLFAGHPTIGTATLLLQLGVVRAEGGKLTQHCGIGPVPLEVDDGVVYAQIAQRAVTRLDVDLSAVFGGVALDSPMSIDVGPVWVVARVSQGARQLHELSPDLAAIVEIEKRLGAVGITLYAVEDDGVFVRSFAPGSGIAEDPVCGSGNGAVAIHLREIGRTPAGGAYLSRQGRCVGRDGYVRVRWRGERLQVGGHATRVVSGQFLHARNAPSMPSLV